ncbi:MAG TPA: phosphatase PAP2 family protein [Anaerolineae bacterium]|nr:phosphatase PAP2 family protein [Anaerolineae bacterium]HMR67258.1 phosphatase PAP2 family protein [Anaerolineae bacterium]
MDDTLLTLLHTTAAHPLLDGLMVILTRLGLPGLPLLGLMLSLSAKQRRLGLSILLGLGLAFLAVFTFQFLALRPRPEAVRAVIATPGFPSFPSGHAAAAFSVAMVVALWFQRWTWSGGALLGATLIAVSRLYLGVHYPSDVLGGALLGASIGAMVYGLFGRPEPDWRWLLWPQIALAAVVTQMAYLQVLPTQLLLWPLADKVLHFLLFGAIVFWLNLWLRGRMVMLAGWALPMAILLPGSVAFLEEAAQTLSPVRTADPTDLASDLAGMLFFWGLSQVVIARTNKKEHPV